MITKRHSLYLHTYMYEVWLKSNGTGRPVGMVKDPQTSETHDVNL